MGSGLSSAKRTASSISRWPVGRSVAWFSGCALLVVATVLGGGWAVIVSGTSGSAQEKMATLEKKGVGVIRDLSEIGNTFKKIL